MTEGVLSFFFKARHASIDQLDSILEQYKPYAGIDIHPMVLYYLIEKQFVSPIIQLRILELTKIEPLDPGLICAAIRGGSVDLIYPLLQRGIDVNSTLVGGEEMTLLHFACKHNSYNAVRIFVEAGADIKHTDIYGHTPIYMSIMFCAIYLTERIPRRAKACREAIVTLILCRRHTLGPFRHVDKHNVLQICQLLWSSRRNPVWT